MSVQIPQDVIEVYGADHLVEIIEANEFGPDIDEGMAERIIEVAEQRTQSRMTDSLNVGDKDYLVMTTWDNFCRETFGSTNIDGNSVPNRFGLATINWDVSSGRDAYLCEEAVALDQGWLEMGDGRRSKIEDVDKTNSEYHDEVRTCWTPRDYTAVVGFSDDLLTPDPQLEDAM